MNIILTKWHIWVTMLFCGAMENCKPQLCILNQMLLVSTRAKTKHYNHPRTNRFLRFKIALFSNCMAILFNVLDDLRDPVHILL